MKIVQFLRTKINLIALAICAAFGGFYMILVAKIYYSVPFDGIDVASFIQALWRIDHGSFFSSIFNTNIFIDHCSFLCFFLAPLHWLDPDPLLLQYIKLAAFFTGGYTFFLILKKRLDPFIALGAMIAFMLIPANAGMLEFSFNYEPFSIPLVCFIFKALDEKKYSLYIICCFLLAMVKEQMPMVVMMFGVLAFFFRKDDRLRWALIPFVMGLVIFIFDVFIFMPYLGRSLPTKGLFYWSRYAQFGKTPHDILLFFLLHPLLALGKMIYPLNIKWYNDLFGLIGGISLFSPQLLLPALPLFIKTLLSSATFEKQVFFNYYGSTFTPFIFLAFWNTLNHIQNKWRLFVHGLAVTILLIHALIFVPFWFYWLDRHPFMGSANRLVEERFMEKIPPQASVLVADSFLIPMADRSHIYPFKTYLLGEYDVSGLKFTLPEDTDYLLLNYSDEYRLLQPQNRPFLRKMIALNDNDHWRLVESIEDIALYKKNLSHEKPDRLIEKSHTPFIRVHPQRSVIGSAFSLEGMEYPQVFPSKYRIFPTTMYWKCIKTAKVFYLMKIDIISNTKVIYTKQRLIGSSIYPTYCWHHDEYIKEKYFYLLPHLKPGKYKIDIGFYDLSLHHLGQNVKKQFFVQ